MGRAIPGRWVELPDFPGIELKVYRDDWEQTRMHVRTGPGSEVHEVSTYVELKALCVRLTAEDTGAGTSD